MANPSDDRPRRQVPAAVRQRARASGEIGTRWLEHLPDVVRTLEEQWRITVGSSMTGGTASFVAAAVTAEGEPVVLKVALPAEVDGLATFANAVRAYTLADGHGCARLLAHDDARHALLLERLGPTLDELALPVPRQLEVLCATLQQLWTPIPNDTTLPTGADKAGWLGRAIASWWHALDHPCAERTVEQALRFASARAEAYDPETAVLVHGDAHSWNALEAGSGTFRFVDPEGLKSHPANDLAVPMRELNVELASDGHVRDDARRIGEARARHLSHLTGVDATAIWEWGFVERVATGLSSLTLGLDDWGREHLAIADAWAEVT